MKHSVRYRHLVQSESVCSGAPRIEGTRIRVVDVAGRFAAGDSVGALAKDFDVSEEAIIEAIRALCAASFGQRGLFANVEKELAQSVDVQLS